MSWQIAPTDNLMGVWILGFFWILTNVIRGPHRAVGSSPRRVESLRLRTHSWSMLGEIRLDPSPQPDKNG